MAGRTNYSINKNVIIDNNGLFIYMDLNYPGLYHDATCVRFYELDTIGITTSLTQMNTLRWFWAIPAT